MRILLTNDDGIDSVGLRALSDAAVRRGHLVYISAPADQCSANSQHITLTGPVCTRKREIGGAQAAYAVQGTPCDCVRIAGPLYDNVKFDFCLSGINNGENVGSGVYYSGTFSAAREAAMQYIPAAAVSIEKGSSPEALRAAAENAVLIIEKAARYSFPRMAVLNLNYPEGDPETWQPMRACPQSRTYYIDEYETRLDPRGERYFWLSSEEHIEEAEEGSDLYLVRRGVPCATLITSLSDENGDQLMRAVCGDGAEA